MKKLFAAFLIIFIVYMGMTMPHIALAHFLQTDGTISGVLHVDPNDDPIAEAPAQITIQTKDTGGKLILSDCNCTLSIQDPNGAAIQIPNTTISGDTITAPYVFPTSEVVTVIFDGAPKITGAFQGFHLAYPLRVEPAHTESKLAAFLETDISHFIIIGVGIIAAIIVVVSEKRKEMGH